AKAGSQKAWARAHGLSQAYVSDVLQRKRGISDSVAEALGYRVVVTYQKLQKRKERRNART
ncbi:MAG: hypothetical protein KGL39_50465, partial [Patescibacteria group bacterium]|nr:hypothetical protein [Patescibacteria group bacterium]